MEIERTDPPREFKVGAEPQITMRDCGRVHLQADEQLTLMAGEREYDVARKSWGFYATPSTNGRLRNHQLRTALVANRQDRIYVMLVQQGCEDDFTEYLRRDDQRVLMWLDADDAVRQFDRLAEQQA